MKRARPLRRRATAAALLAGLTLAGCAVGPDYAPPELEVPDAWHMELTRGLSQGEANLQTWWDYFDDPLIADLVQRSAEGNFDLRQAIARIDQSRAERGIARGDWFPTTDAIGSYQRARTSNRISSDVPDPQQRTDNFFSTGFDATWEIDVFGRIRRQVESASAGLQASIEDYRDVLVSLFADVAIAYIDVRTFQERIRVTQANIQAQRGTLSIVRDRNRAGLVGDLDVRQAEQNLASTESTLPVLRQGLAFSIHRLGVLLGKPPSSLYAELTPIQEIPSVPTEVLVGIPAELLRQRPDVRAAERALAEQTAQIGVATADLYPRFSLLGTFAFEATDVASWIAGKPSSSFSFGPSVRWNIFDGGRIRSNIELEEARTQEALDFYENTVLLALEDVENAFVAFVEEQERRDALERSAIAAARATGLVQTLYRTGLTDFQNVLDTERSQFEREDELAESEGQVSQNLVAIYRALGGGWTP